VSLCFLQNQPFLLPETAKNLQLSEFSLTRRICQDLIPRNAKAVHRLIFPIFFLDKKKRVTLY
jgi:hypothetical protein